MYLLPYVFLSWLIWDFVTFVPAYILGWILVPLAAVLRAYTLSWDFTKEAKGEDPRIVHFLWPFMKLWDNYEDGAANTMYWVAPNMFLQIVYWSCIRNPVSGLRSIPWLLCQINPDKVRFTGSFGNNLAPRSEIEKYDTKVPQWFIARQGLWSNFYLQFNMLGGLWRLWFGTAKIYPTDIYGVTEYRKNGAGSVAQFKRVT